MIESTKPVTDTDDEPEILARYTKVLPKGRYACGYSLKADLQVEVERTPEEWIVTVEMESLYLWGAGATEEQAVDDLVYVLGEVRDSHRSFKDGPAPCPERELQLLEDVVVCNNSSTAPSAVTSGWKYGKCLLVKYDEGPAPKDKA